MTSRTPNGTIVFDLSPHAQSTIIWAFVAFGAALRIIVWADNRPFWLDEAWLALNVRERGFLDLLRPLAKPSE